MKRFQVCVKNRKCLSCVSFSKKIEGKSYQALIFNRSDTMVCAGDTIVNQTRCPCPHRTQSPTQETNIKHLISHLISIVKSDMEENYRVLCFRREGRKVLSSDLEKWVEIEEEGEKASQTVGTVWAKIAREEEAWFNWGTERPLLLSCWEQCGSGFGCGGEAGRPCQAWGAVLQI